MPSIQPVLPILLAGGVGVRLAPISTAERPKPFIPLADGESLLTKTLKRIAAPPFLPPLLIGRAADRFALLNHARAARVTPQAILLETDGRNTAPAVALASAWAQRHLSNDPVLVILPADQLIGSDEAWRNAIALATQADELCLLAAPARAPDPAFGYILTEQGKPPHRVTRFVEKPADPLALIAQGAHWNMGQFAVRADTLAALFAQFAPDMAKSAATLLDGAQPDYEFTLLPAWPSSIEAAPFDRVIVERTPSRALLYDGLWQDLGSLTAWQDATGLDIAHYLELPPRTDRPWGYFETLDRTAHHTQKNLVLYPGCRLSRQRHAQREETWRVLKGIASVELENKRLELRPGEAVTIPIGSWHRLGNGQGSLLIIEEIQNGVCEESDIERIEDDYGRL